jgi:protein pelota
MRIIERDMGHGAVEVEVEDSDDLWHLYNLIDSGDTVCGYTMREVRVSRGGGEERGGRRRVFLCIKVEDLGFQSFTERLRIRGRVIIGPEDMNIQGSYHSFSVGPRERIRIVKDEWLSFHEERLKRATAKERPKALIITIDDQEASIYLLRDYNVEELVSIASHMPGKYVESVDRSTIRSKYFSSIGEEVSRFLQKESVYVVVAGPGFTKNELAKYLRNRFRSLSIIEETASCTGEPGVREVINRGTFSKIMANSTLLRDSRLVDELLARLSTKPSLVAYGREEVKRAVEGGAVDALLVSERLLKTIAPDERRAIEDVCKRAEGYGGKVYFIGGEHEKGKQLISLGGIAALLRFAIT